ncbi:uncharacterized protein LOC143069162 isoform X1 [Mytilus galloprovincialis]|uniref:uncharacterized protein LOC143069162 isoform X1 n=1 Tax=Mytilus galloprovincialis TaxID=29158 RepID=UPI003F7CA2B6
MSKMAEKLVLPKLPARRETAIISVVKDGEIFRKFIVRTDIVTLLKLESGDEEAMSRFLEERDYVDGQVTVSILRVESSQATDMPSMSTQASTSATSQASTSATSQASTSATSLASTSAKQIPSTSSTWSKDSEKFLLDLYDKYEKSKSFIKNKWVRISQEIAEKLSIQVTPEQCRIKIRSMKDRFERMKKKLKTSGESNIEIPTEFTVFESQHDVQPKYLLDSSKPKKAESSSEEEETSNPTPSKRKMKVSTSCPEPQVDLMTPFTKNSWRGYLLHQSCNIAGHSCRNSIVKSINQRDMGGFLGNPFGFIRVAYLTRFPTTTPRYQTCDKMTKQIEFKFHSGCQNGC